MELGLGLVEAVLDLLDLLERSEHQEESLLSHVDLEAERVCLEMLRGKLLQRLEKFQSFF